MTVTSDTAVGGQWGRRRECEANVRLRGPEATAVFTCIRKILVGEGEREGVDGSRRANQFYFRSEWGGNSNQRAMRKARSRIRGT